ncbi:F-box/LRR-repeat protein At3g59190-like [Spinacia oleracea]|uniref:F-box/LRR-repeat protein At3g59190-like n=1 Tax=Spinacia oleracea TaxID=3562 RepID=A0A9R0I256_SPIOL|nr:F-box/LRR-repeat protein At3g59190-like [Spinacia oleracea]
MAVKFTAVHKNKKRKKSNQIKVKEDIISSLHDDYLVDILSLMSLDVAVATSFFARQWRDLWTEVTAIHINIKTSKGPFKYWNTFQEKILPKLTSPLIRRFGLDINCGALSTYASDQIDLWYQLISARWKIEEVKVKSNGFEGHISFPTIFKIPTLVVLELSGDIDSFVISVDEVNLPNLKKLSIQIDFTQSTQYLFIEKLDEYCPLLEELSLKCCKVRGGGLLIPGHVPLSGKNLKRLSVQHSGYNPAKIIDIDAPRLEYLTLYSSIDLFRFVSTPIGLVEAHIGGNLHNGLMTSKLFDSICNLRTLTLRRAMISETPTLFSDLTHLICTISRSEADFNAVLGLLERCPVLEALILNITTTCRYEKVSEPAFMLTRVEKVWMKFGSSLLLNKDALNMMNYMLSSARVLKELVLEVTGWSHTDFSDDDSDSDVSDGDVSEEEENLEVEACREAFEWARCSFSRYQVDFLGKYLQIKLSGDEPKLIRTSKGRIICI